MQSTDFNVVQIREVAYTRTYYMIEASKVANNQLLDLY